MNATVTLPSGAAAGAAHHTWKEAAGSADCFVTCRTCRPIKFLNRTLVK